MNEIPADMNLWRRQHIETIGLSFEVYRPWLFETAPLEGGENLYQRIADTGGLLFLRYGTNETLEAFLPTLEDYVIKATIASDEPILFLGAPARRVVIRSIRQKLGVYLNRAEGGPLHVEEPEKHTFISAIGFRRRGMPVLVGCRLPEERVAEFQPILERFMSGVLADEPGAEGKQ